jgi:hypothetical protein
MNDVAYASARIAARFGARPQDADWHRIEQQRALAALLEAARATPLARHTAGLASGQDVHAIAAVLRGHRRALAREVADWMPAGWHPALAWLAVAPDLAVCAHLAAGRPPRPWMRDDAVYRALLAPGHDAGADDAPARAGRVAADAALAALAAPGNDTSPAGERWRVEWHRRLPRAAPPMLVEAGLRVAVHFGAAFGPSYPAAHDPAPRTASAAPRTASAAAMPATAAPATGARAALSARLTRLYRRCSCEPAAAFAYLGLALVDLERLEGELARRALFPDLPLAA